MPNYSGAHIKCQMNTISVRATKAQIVCGYSDCSFVPYKCFIQYLFSCWWANYERRTGNSNQPCVCVYVIIVIITVDILSRCTLMFLLLFYPKLFTSACSAVVFFYSILATYFNVGIYISILHAYLTHFIFPFVLFFVFGSVLLFWVHYFPFPESSCRTIRFNSFLSSDRFFCGWLLSPLITIVRVIAIFNFTEFDDLCRNR